MSRFTFESHAGATKWESLSEESGAEAPAKSALIFDLSLSQGLSLLAPKSERETQNEVKRLPPTRVFLKREPVYRLGKRIPCFIQIAQILKF